MSQPTVARSSERRIALKPAAVRLLRSISQHDKGQGVTFEFAPAGRWQLAGTDYRVNNCTFFPLDAHGLIDVGNGRTDPVRITIAGRAHLVALARTSDVTA